MIKKLYSRFESLVPKVEWLAPLLTRLTVGLLFLGTGWGKLHGLPDLISYFRDLGIPYPHLQAPFVAAVEFVCGGLLLLGLATRLASIPLICTMVVAILTAKRGDLEGISDLVGLNEFMLIVLCFWLLVKGAGRLSLDHLLCKGSGRRSNR